MALTNAHGVIGLSFRIGIGLEDSVTLIYEKDKDNALHIDKPLNMDECPVRTEHAPTDPFDVVNLGTANEMTQEVYKKAIDFTNSRLNEVLEGGGENTPGTAGNIMLQPVEVSELSDGLVIPLGKLKMTKFISQIAIEVLEPFKYQDGSRYRVAIGTADDPECYVPYFELTGSKSKLIDVIHTLTDDEELIATVKTYTMAPDEGQFTYKFQNEHKSVHTDISTVGLSSFRALYLMAICDDPSGLDIIDTDTFGAHAGKGLADFFFNIPTVVGHKYRMEELNNPALQFQADDRPVQYTDDIWSSITEFTATETSTLIGFLLQPRTKEEHADYVHFTFYDLDGEEPDEPILTVHVYNSLGGADRDSLLMPSKLPIATYESAGAIIVDEKFMQVDTDGKVSLNIASPEEITELVKSSGNTH